MTEFDRIKAMSVEEMGKFIHNLLTKCDACGNDCEKCEYNEINMCMDNIFAEQWLNSEVTE